VFATWRFAFDRHLLLFAPTAIALFCVLLEPAGAHAVQPRFARFAAALAPLALYGIAATHDLHAISRAAFHAGEALIARGVDPTHIDGGYAFDGWHVYEVQKRGAPVRARASDAWWIRTIFQTIETEYVLSLSPSIDRVRLANQITQPDRALFLRPDLNGYRAIATEPYVSYWPPGMRHLYVLHRE